MSAAATERIVERIVPRPIDLEAVSVRLQRDGVVVEYIMPPAGKPGKVAAATLPQARHYCETQREIAAHRLAAQPDSRLYAHELAVFSGLVRVLDACLGSDVIKDELRRAYRERAAQVEADEVVVPDAEADQSDAESTS